MTKRVYQMLTKIVIIFILFAVIFALGASLYFLVKDKSDSSRTVNALTWRIIFTLILIVFILFGCYFGWIHPNQLF